MSAKKKMDYVRLTFTSPENELTAVELAAREWLRTSIQEAMERFHEEATGQDSVLGIEFYPCECDERDCNCEH
jgi:hypothetical protein